MVRSPLSLSIDRYKYAHALNEKVYVVESPDAIEPACDSAYTVMRYPENNLSAAIAYKGAYKTFVMGFPFETLTVPLEREKLMKEITLFFER